MCKLFCGMSRAPSPTIFTHNPIFDPEFIGLKGSSLTEELAPKATEEVNVCRVFLYKIGKLGGSLHLIRLLHVTASRKIHLPRQGEGLINPEFIGLINFQFSIFNFQLKNPYQPIILFSIWVVLFRIKSLRYLICSLKVPISSVVR